MRRVNLIATYKLTESQRLQQRQPLSSAPFQGGSFVPNTASHIGSTVAPSLLSSHPSQRRSSIRRAQFTGSDKLPSRASYTIRSVVRPTESRQKEGTRVSGDLGPPPKLNSTIRRPMRRDEDARAKKEMQDQRKIEIENRIKQEHESNKQLKAKQDLELRLKHQQQLKSKHEQQQRLRQQQEFKSKEAKFKQQQQLRLKQQQQLKLKQEQQAKLKQQRELKLKQQNQLKLKQQQEQRLKEAELRRQQEIKRQEEHKKYLERERQREEQQKKEKLEKERLEKIKQEEQERERKQKQEDAKAKSHLKIGLIGLNNIGNTCYLNSILQCLFNLPGFNGYFLSGKYQSDVRGYGKVAEAYAKLLGLIRNTITTSENPSTLKSAVAARNYQFGGYKQQDANQFLVCLLDFMGQDLKLDYQAPSVRPRAESLLQRSQATWQLHLSREHSHINSYFGGQYVSSIHCESCGKSVDSFDPFWDVQLAFSKDRTTDDLITMMNRFTMKEDLDGYSCQSCKSVSKCSRQVLFCRLPSILVVHLKRFEYDIEEKGVKIDNSVRFPLTFSLDSYLVRGAKQQSSYSLSGLVQHSGQLDYGHYTATCKNTSNGKWYTFNDSYVSECLDYTGKVQKTSSEAYVLFYARRGLG